MKILVTILSICVLVVSSFNIFGILDSLKFEEVQKTNLLSYSDYVGKQKEIEKQELSLEISKYIEGKNPLYIDGIVVVNKDYCVPKDYISYQEDEANKAFETMKKDASEEGITLNIRSGHRSYNSQVGLFNKYAQKDGSQEANTYSAKPGHSEHQTGLAFDITNKNTNKAPGDWFDNTPESKWLYKNAHKYGFILRYPEGKQHITGYIYESWHYRYIGPEHSKNFNMNNLTLEEYLDMNK
ncbi:MAG: M15 family metallopeptidase [Romboutsia sp.]